jgi:ferredoxin
MPAKVDKGKCTACGNCVEVCPCEAITLEDIAKIDEKECTECGVCVDECPSDAIRIEG